MHHKPLIEDRIHQMIASYPEAPEATAPRIAQAQPFALAFLALAEGMHRALKMFYGSRWRGAGPRWGCEVGGAVRPY